MRVVAFDPGAKCAGWACFDDGVLTSVGLSRTKAMTLQGRAQDHRKEIHSLFADIIIGERMTYRGRRSLGSPQILMDLNLITGYVSNFWVEPAMWKGCIPKEEHQPHILAMLTEAERKLVDAVKPASLRHNAVDAVGIGLWYIDRDRPMALPTPKELLTDFEVTGNMALLSAADLARLKERCGPKELSTGTDSTNRKRNRPVRGRRRKSK